MPCTPVNIPSPTAPSGPPIPGIGIPHALQVPNISPFPSGFPESLIDLFNNHQLLIPPGILKPNLSINYSKDLFDSILSMLDQFLPFLMLYKFFLPVLNLIICIIEVLCALMNPFALISAINKLFNQCLPAFLNMFPIFALVIMIISLLLLLLALVEYIISQVLKLIQDILRNINALNKSFQDADSNAVLAIAHKLGALLCSFQNVFVLLSIFNVVIEIIKDMLRQAFSIPPCENSSDSGCCSPITCPAFLQKSYTNTTGTFQYLPEVSIQTTNYSSIFTPNNFVELRAESWQLFDVDQSIVQAFSNIYNAFDIPSNVNPKPVFFPTDSIYNANTPVPKAPYTVDLRLYYNPAPWHRPGLPRFIRFTNCIMQFSPTPFLKNWNNEDISENTGVIYLVGGAGFEDDGTTVLPGFAADGVSPIGNQATLENFIHMDGYSLFNNPQHPITTSLLHPTDGYTFSNATYTFKPNLEVLLNKQLVTLGCEPSIVLNRTFVNTVLFSNIGIQTTALNDLVNGLNGNTFPDPNGTLNCLSTALSGLRSNLSTEGVATFQATALTCLNNLQDDTNSALASMIGIGFNACKSSLSLDPTVQFTSQTITVTVNINENNGLSLTQGIPASVGAQVALRIRPHITFGDITNFSYDGYQAFTAQISSPVPGSGQISVSFDNQIFCTDTISSDPTVPPSHTLQTLNYQFVYTPVAGVTSLPSVDGQPRRDAGDVGRDGSVSKDGV